MILEELMSMRAALDITLQAENVRDIFYRK